MYILGLSAHCAPRSALALISASASARFLETLSASARQHMLSACANLRSKCAQKSMFFRQDLMEITLKLTLIPLKITKVINFHSQHVFT